MTIWHCHVAVSLDGRLARKDGSVEDWLVADYTPDSTAFAGFLAGVDAILMGGTPSTRSCGWGSGLIRGSLRW